MAARKASKKNRWRAARDAAGLSTDDAMVAIRTAFPERFWTSRSSINRLENGEQALDVCQLMALAHIYRRPLRDIDPLAALDYEEWLERVGDRANAQSLCFGLTPDHDLIPA